MAANDQVWVESNRKLLGQSCQLNLHARMTGPDNTGQTALARFLPRAEILEAALRRSCLWGALSEQMRRASELVAIG